MPVSRGTDHDNASESAPEDASTIEIGALGTTAGVKDIELDGTPYPTAFLASTLSSTAEPAVSPVIVLVVPVTPLTRVDHVALEYP
jgi:hypothetical protein